MDKKMVITISRQYGSGGRDIGKKLALELGIPYYDKEIISMAARSSGFSEEVFEEQDKPAANSLLYALSLYGGSMGSTGTFFDLPLNDKVYIAQSKIIRQVAEEGPCVIVGRCADYVLKDIVPCINVFIHADAELRAKRVAEVYKTVPDGATPLEVIQNTDKRRATYYGYYTGHKWGRAENYDISINSAKPGINGTVEVLHQFVEAAQK